MPISLRSILILCSHLRLGLPKGLFPVGLPVNILKARLPSSILATCPAHLNLLDLITRTIVGERYKLIVIITMPSLWINHCRFLLFGSSELPKKQTNSFPFLTEN